jgi:hypothetical protein
VELGSTTRIGLCCATAAAAAALLAGACGDGPGEGPLQAQQLEQALCHKLVECGCGESFRELGLQAPLDCEGWTIESLIGSGPRDPYYYAYGYEGYGPTAQLPISVDEECLEHLADALEQASCDSLAISWRCDVACRPYFGPGLEGQPCYDTYACGRGLYCAGTECRDPCQVFPVGEGERCDSFGCRHGLVCSIAPTADFPICVRPPRPGEPCDRGDCSEDAWCDDNGVDVPTCVATQEIGAPCSGHMQCETVYCPAGFCAARPSVGMGCGADAVCEASSMCIYDDGGEGTCVPAPPLCQELLESVVPLLDDRAVD